MNIELFYQEKGNGYPLLLLHGNGEDHTYFKAQMDYFSDFYRTIAIDTCKLRDRPDSFAEQNGRGAERADIY